MKKAYEIAQIIPMNFIRDQFTVNSKLTCRTKRDLMSITFDMLRTCKTKQHMRLSSPFS